MKSSPIHPPLRKCLLLLLVCLFGLLPCVQAESMTPALTISSASNAFGFKLYDKIAAQDKHKNLFMSPISVFSALAMTSEGTANESLKTLQTVLGLPETATLHEGLKTLARSLNPADAPFALALANAVWPEKSFHLQPMFLKTIQEIYGGASIPLDFKTDPEAARKTINAWVEQKTKDRIKDLIPDGAIGNSTRMVLTNAIYFKGKWTNEFDKKLTQDQSFMLENGGKVVAPLMFQPASGRSYAEVNGVQVVRLPYKGDALSMVILLPQVGQMGKLEQGLNADQWTKISNAMSYEQVNVWLPRFKMTIGGSIKDPLEAMGLQSLFQSCDFSRMFAEDVPFAVSDVVHKAFIEVNEEGTEAAAATAVLVKETSASFEPNPPKNFRADHPFIFMIEHNASKSILFMGKVMNPGG